MSTSVTYRVLHVTECYAGGVSRAIEGIVEEAPSVEHHLLYTGNERPPQHDRYASVAELPQTAWSRVAAVQTAVRSLLPDAVHLHSSWAGFYGRLGRKLPTRVIYQPHCYAFEDLRRPAGQRAIFKLAERMLGSRAHTVVAVSERERNLASRLAPQARVAVVPNKSTLAFVEKRASLPTGRPRVVMTGRLCAQKDPDFFGDVACRVRAMGSDFEFLWIGDGDPFLRARLESSGVRVTGWLGRNELQAEIDAAALYFHSALYEGFPLSILDAAARNVPIGIRQSPAFEGAGLSLARDAAEAAVQIETWASGETPDLFAMNSTAIRTVFHPRQVAPAIQQLYRNEVAT